MLESSVNYRGQTTVPDAVRDALGLQTGDKVRYVVIDEGFLMMYVRPTSRLSGSLKYDGPPVGVKDMDDAIAEGAIGDCPGKF
ncbi:MAG: type II toxin-antitoxin system PrlF family antitoxin [Chloroflexi bacterium]|nr:type II toxin-antitoxin system PrlF family antitoxin [Chloroflexota bacterium]